MISIKNILCPVDFFPASDAAVNYAAGLAANYDAGIHLLHVVTPVVTGGFEYSLDTSEIMTSLKQKAEEELAALSAKLRGAGIITEYEVCVGDAYEAIKQAIEDLKPEIVVMGTHGRRGVERWFMGSTTEKLMRHSPVPLITINPAGEKTEAPRFKRILVTTDFSEGTSDALAYAFSVAQENESKITLLHVIHDVTADVSGKYRESLIEGVEKQLEDLVPPEATTWCDVNLKVETGVPYRIIPRVLEDEKIDLLVMNIHGKGMLDRALLGSTAERVVRIARCPVMLIPPLKKKMRRKARPGGTRTAA
jgi:nucleotide-binding universal stress UspA family protein